MTRIVSGVIFHEIRTLSKSPAPYGRSTSGTISARIDNKQRARVAAIAARNQCTVGELARYAITRLRAGLDEPEGILADVAAALGLGPDAAPSDVLAAVTQLVSDVTAPSNPDPLAQVADAPPAQLSAADRATAAKISDPKRRAVYLAMRAQHQANLARKPVVQSKPKAKSK